MSGENRENTSTGVLRNEAQIQQGMRIVESRIEKIVVRCPSPSRAYRLGTPCDQDATDLPRASTGASSPLTPNHLNCCVSQLLYIDSGLN